MKKKILSCAMACAMVAPAAFALAGCGKDDDGGDKGPKQYNITLNVTAMNDAATFINTDNLTPTAGNNGITTYTAKVEEGKDYTFAFKYAAGMDHDGTVVKIGETEINETKVYYNDETKTAVTGNVDFSKERIIEYKVSNVQADTSVDATLDSLSMKYHILTLDSSIVSGAKYMMGYNYYDFDMDFLNGDRPSNIFDVPADGKITINVENYDNPAYCVLLLDEDIDAIDVVDSPIFKYGRYDDELSSKTFYANYTNAGNKVLYEGKSAFVIKYENFYSTIYPKQNVLTSLEDELKNGTASLDVPSATGVANVANQDLFTLYHYIPFNQKHNTLLQLANYSNLAETVEVFDDTSYTRRTAFTNGEIDLITADLGVYTDLENNMYMAHAYVGEVGIDHEDSFVKFGAENGIYSDYAATHTRQEISKNFVNSLGRNIYLQVYFDNYHFNYYDMPGHSGVPYTINDFNFYIVDANGTKTPITNFVTMMDTDYPEDESMARTFAVITPEEYNKYLTTGKGRVGDRIKEYKTGYAFFTYEPKEETKARMVKVTINADKTVEKGFDSLCLDFAHFRSNNTYNPVKDEDYGSTIVNQFATYDPATNKSTYYVDREYLNRMNKEEQNYEEKDVRLGVKLNVLYDATEYYLQNGTNKVCRSITVTVTDGDGNKLIDNQTYDHPQYGRPEDAWDWDPIIMLDTFDVLPDLDELIFDIQVNYDDFANKVTDTADYSLFSELGAQQPMYIASEFSRDFSEWNKRTTSNLGTIKVGDTLYLATRIESDDLCLAQRDFEEENMEDHDKTDSRDYRQYLIRFEILEDAFGNKLTIPDPEDEDEVYYIYKVTIPENNFDHHHYQEFFVVED